MKREVLLERKARTANGRRNAESALRGESMFALVVKSHELTQKCLSKVPEDKQRDYMKAHTEYVHSDDHEFGYSILWGPNSQVITQYERVDGKSMMCAVWPRRAYDSEHKILLRQELKNRFTGKS